LKEYVCKGREKFETLLCIACSDDEVVLCCHNRDI
jgi:hypothetical protein